MPVALLALAIGGFGIGLTEFVIMGLLPEVANDFSVTETGMSKTTQCQKPLPVGASGSKHVTAKLRVSGGKPSQRRWGEVFPSE